MRIIIVMTVKESHDQGKSYILKRKEFLNQTWSLCVSQKIEESKYGDTRGTYADKTNTYMNPLEQEMLDALRSEQNPKTIYTNGNYGDLHISSVDMGPDSYVVMPSPTGAAEEHRRMVAELRRVAEIERRQFSLQLAASYPRDRPAVVPDVLEPIKKVVETNTHEIPKERKIKV